MFRRLAVLASALLAVTFVPGVAVAGGGNGNPHLDPTPGAPGIGDPYYPLDGNGGYDVLHYDLQVRYDPDTDVLSGVAEIDAVATQDLSSFNLDFVGLTVRSITVDKDDATWSRDEGELTVTPEDPIRDGTKFRTVVTYDGIPETIVDPLFGPMGFIPTDDGAIVAGQPHAAATWFPANDHPRDAASLSIDVTVPAGLEAISNGVLQHSRTRDGWTTWSWRAKEPMATYLTVLAIGEFDLRHYNADGLRFWDALDPDLFDPELADNGNPEPDLDTFGEVADASFARQPEIIGFLEDIAGPYPFSAAGGIVDDFDQLFFALETQTRPIYSLFFFFDQFGGDDVVVHELAHQWFGDDLRLDSWQHIWLNEGFATYMEWLWFEREGLATPQEIFESLASIPADDPFWELMTGDPGPALADLFDFEATYLRGAMTLHALRLTVGDDVFFSIVRDWAATQSGDTVTTDEFIALAEKESGMQLDEFFDAWLFTAAKPPGLPEASPEPGVAAQTAATPFALPGATPRR